MAWTNKTLLKRTPPPGFVDIPGYEGRYYASRDGRIYSRVTNRILVKNKMRHGYHAVKLRLHPWSKRRFLTVHRLIAAVFIGPCPIGHEVDHKNKNKSDDRAANLRYVPRGHNMHNRRKTKKKCTSRFRGVIWCHGRWQAMIRVNGVGRILGRYKNELIAAKMYDKAALGFYGPLASTNYSLGLLT
jgi:hypothetical protein